MAAPTRCVVDTNVAVTANGGNSAASVGCAASSAKALQDVMAIGHVFIDDGGRMMAEYRANLKDGQRGPGDAFFMWLLTHEWGEIRVTRVPITPKNNDQSDFEELPKPPDGVRYDPSDRKWLAVAAAHAEHPPILQSFDSKWWSWQEALGKVGVSIYFLCAEEIARKYREKTER